MLKHKYRSTNTTAAVSIEHVREGLPRSATDVGCWLNVIGYVQGSQPEYALVQATVLWETGPFKLEDYERALQARKDAKTTG